MGEEKAAGEGYEEGDTVSSQGLVFACKSWPYSMHCGQQGYGPLLDPATDYWKDAWDLIGHCNGVRSPTASPSFVEIAMLASGCPAEFSASSTNYDAGDLVALTVSIKPERKIVYMCRDFPNNGYCNLSGFQPGSQYGHMGWKQIGACSGTLTPTAAPTVYDRPCKYNKCIQVESSEQCTPGSIGCSCNTNDMAGPNCLRGVEREVCSDVDVTRWSES